MVWFHFEKGSSLRNFESGEPMINESQLQKKVAIKIRKNSILIYKLSEESRVDIRDAELTATSIPAVHINFGRYQTANDARRLSQLNA